MNRNSNPLLQILLILISGLLLILSFPTYSWGGYLAWVALIPFFWVIFTENSIKTAVFYSLLLGMVFYGGTFAWLLAIHPLDWMGFSIPLSALVLLSGWLALSFYHSLFWVVFGAALQSIRRDPLKRFLLPPLLWPLLEIVRQWGPAGFPWSNLAISQQDNLLMLQSLSLFGMEGLDAAIILVNLSLALLLLSVAGKLQDQARFYSLAEPLRSFFQLGVALLAVGSFALYGYFTLKNGPQGEPVRVSLLQGNIPQNMKWSPAMRDHISSVYRDLAQKALSDNPDIILMPETALPFFVAKNPEELYRFRSLLQTPSIALVMGVPDWFTAKDGRRYFTNSAVALTQSGPTLPQYDKQKLVMFGEYIPLRFLLPPFLEKLDLLGEDYTSTNRIAPLPTSKGRLGIAICFDSLFPEVLKRETQEGAELLAVMTNDGWYKASTAAFHHFAIARLRAVEERRYLIRAANTGISGIIDPYGRVLAKSELLTEEVISGEVRMVKNKSIYNQYGFFFPLLLIGGIILIFLPRKPVRGYS